MSLLDLDDPRWSELRHALGLAHDVPALLRRLREAPDDRRAWDDVWTKLCHQGAACPASFAAVPHVLALAAELEPERRRQHLWFASAVEQDRLRSHLAVPAWLADDYAASIRSAADPTWETLRARRWGDGDVHALLAAWAAFAGYGRLSCAIESLDGNPDGSYACNECGAKVDGVDAAPHRD